MLNDVYFGGGDGKKPLTESDGYLGSSNIDSWTTFVLVTAPASTFGVGNRLLVIQACHQSLLKDNNHINRGNRVPSLATTK